MKPEILHPVIREEDRLAVDLAASSIDNAMAAMEGLRAEIMRLTGAPDCILTSSCTQALRVAIKLFAKPGKVCVPDLTFVATAHAALAAGYELAIQDVDAVTLQIDTPGYSGINWSMGCAAIVPVELLGRPLTDKLVAGLWKYSELVGHEVPIIVDAAQSFGVTKWRSEYTALCISFAANKIVHGHQGGAILCSTECGKVVRQYCKHGRDASRPNDYYHVTAGENVAMNPLGAALALSQTKRIESIMGNRWGQHCAYLLADAIDDRLTVENCENFWVHVAPKTMNEGKPSDRLWEPLHRMPHLAKYAHGEYKNADAAFEELVFLPSSDDLTPEAIEETYSERD